MSYYGKRLPAEYDINTIRVLKQYQTSLFFSKKRFLQVTRNMEFKTKYWIVLKIVALFCVHLLSMTCKPHLCKHWIVLSKPIELTNSVIHPLSFSWGHFFWRNLIRPLACISHVIICPLADARSILRTECKNTPTTKNAPKILLIYRYSNFLA